ncbi:MAG: DUF2069 domain-containing protein [Pseudoxanthomonas suwonensis]|nr:DUF2069 domain-containing protein [Pseudoxanthomonas suwonensis]
MNDRRETRRTPRHHLVLRIALLALTALYLAWRLPDGNWTLLALTALPPLLLAIASIAGMRSAGFWAGVLALLWFSHGVMVAWAHPGQRLFALLEIALALVVVFASSHAGLRARFGKHRSVP